MLPDDLERPLAAQLPGNLAPRRLAHRLAVAAASREHVELGAHDDGHIGIWDLGDPGLLEN